MDMIAIRSTTWLSYATLLLDFTTWRYYLTLQLGFTAQHGADGLDAASQMDKIDIKSLVRALFGGGEWVYMCAYVRVRVWMYVCIF